MCFCLVFGSHFHSTQIQMEMIFRCIWFMHVFLLSRCAHTIASKDIICRQSKNQRQDSSFLEIQISKRKNLKNKTFFCSFRPSPFSFAAIFKEVLNGDGSNRFCRHCQTQTYDDTHATCKLNWQRRKPIPDQSVWMMHTGWMASWNYNYRFLSTLWICIFLPSKCDDDDTTKIWSEKEIQRTRNGMKRKPRANGSVLKSIAQSIYLKHLRWYQFCRKEHKQLHVVCSPCTSYYSMYIYRAVNECSSAQCVLGTIQIIVQLKPIGWEKRHSLALLALSKIKLQDLVQFIC